ncbi:MAG: phosphorylase [Betaproteobacteria bacterium RIFCSPLOWO2_12_FULL_62_13]|nr:MAG: phosphorylase [Betaproteobacteria bacterium RIFCSPLOWO2_12_FULL_62_13]
MTRSKLLLAPGAVWPLLERATRHALACGAMQPIETEHEVVEDAGVRFLVRRVSSLARKELERRRAEGLPSPANPFLPHEPDLFVADVSETHVALLNKFNVIDRHLLVVTRRFVHQETLLDRNDLAALLACMAGREALGFYNGGVTAGASQPHKHLQMVPLPLGEGAALTPIEPALDAVPHRPGFCAVPALPFRHAFAWLEPALPDDPLAAAVRLETLCLAALEYIGVTPVEREGERRQSAPYNLLLTRRWLLAVPRAREHFDSISVNALGFAGSLFVRDEAQLAAVKRAGPMAVLRAVAEG